MLQIHSWRVQDLIHSHENKLRVVAGGISLVLTDEAHQARLHTFAASLMITIYVPCRYCEEASIKYVLRTEGGSGTIH